MSSKDEGRDNMEKPLRGAVLCCTSIATEQRTHMAEVAIQMGAEHKLDLTSDVTHLIVGDSNTPKYKYVAKEREDIKILRLEWIEAVRQAWMQGEEANLEALEEEYRLPTFAGLKMCVTGFEDLSFRTHLQEKISANGGEYRGDLTKEVTHLIAYAPEGKKYQYATQWEVKIVGLKWLNDSLDRRMILNEALYHPTIPSDKQGAGAWNRQTAANVQLGKRSRREEAVADVPRKLRRTASAKLGSQSETLWSEIVNGPPMDDLTRNNHLRSSKSSSALRPVVLEPKSFATDSTGLGDDGRKLITRNSKTTDHQQIRKGIFSGFGFFLYAFNSKQMSVLREHILSNDGEIYESLAQIDRNATSDISRLFLIVSYCHPISDLPSVDHLEPPPEIVTDMWAERCLQSKRFVEPDEHVFSRPIPVFPMPGFEKLIINSTGVANIDLLHVSKAIRLLGAKYDQVLKPGISVLLCNSNKAGEDKLRHAREWRIPAVSLEWLWASVRIGKMQSFRPFQLKQGQVPKETDFGPNPNILARQPEPVEILGRGRQAPKNIQHAETGPGKNTLHRDSFLDHTNRHPTSRTSRVMPNPGEAFLKSPQRTEDSAELRSKKKLPPQNAAASEDRREAVEGCEYNDEEAEAGLPMQELATKSPPKSEMALSPRKGRLFRHFDGQSSLPGRAQDDDSPSAPEATSTGKTIYIPPQPESINGAIKELLGKNKVKNSKAAHPTGQSKKKRLLGRALSNMSNSSREGCNIQASRASSIDSVNTDGLGSVILDETSQGRRNSSGAGGRSSFTGRAPVQEQGVKEPPFEYGDAALYREEYHEEEEPPQMTQLGYENPDDAVALREMLAERRRNRTRQGQEDVKPPDAKEGKKIKDDAAVASVGRAAGRRTRQTAKSP